MELVSNCTQISVLPAVNQLICNVVIYILNPPPPLVQPVLLIWEQCSAERERETGNNRLTYTIILRHKII